MDEHYEVLIILVSRDNVIGQDMATRQRDVEALQAYGPPAFAIWPGPYIETFSVVVRNIGKLPLRNAQVVINANLLMTPVTHGGNTFSPKQVFYDFSSITPYSEPGEEHYISISYAVPERTNRDVMLVALRADNLDH